MSTHKLPFGRIELLEEDIAEVIIKANLEMDAGVVDAYEAFLLSHLRQPFGLLINKLNAYSFSFEAQEKIGYIKGINACGIVSYNKATTLITKDLVERTPFTKDNLKFFSNRLDALLWLKHKQAVVKR